MSQPPAVMDRIKPVAVESFRDHVAQKHNERDKGFESEYQVSRGKGCGLADLNTAVVMFVVSGI